MPFLIDGHNLIGALPDLHLDEADDEVRLIERLRAYCISERKQAEVYFDRAAPGRAGRYRYGPVTAVFITAGSTADTAIRRRLGQLGRAAANWTVVSTDNAVQADARSARARVMPSGEFAGLLRETGSDPRPDRDAQMGKGELEEWLRLFGGEDD
jgi:predicted RNA-binding protein with PIN domain